MTCSETGTRSGKDRRRIFSYSGVASKRQFRQERRKRPERRKGWVRVNKWASVYLPDLKIAKYLLKEDRLGP